MSNVDIRDGYRYTKDHEWISGSGKTLLIGISAYAVDQLGDVTLVTIDAKPGDRVSIGKTFGTVESVKTLSDLYAPISGKVLRVNADLESRPELINEDCYGKGWIIEIEPEGSDDGDTMDSAAYGKFVAAAQ